MDNKSIVIKPPANSAAGLKAVTNSIKYITERMSPSKGFKLMCNLNQKGGIDCPGCAWPDPEDPSALGEFCENGIKAIAEEAMDKTAGPDFFRRYSVEELRKKSDYWLGQQGRLSQPMILNPEASHYEPISWEKAFKLLARHLQNLEHPDEAVFYTSGRTGNEAAFLYQLFVRMLGTNNLPDCSNMCHESSGVALKETLGIGKGSITLDDFNQAELIIIMGQNPATNHPRMLNSLEQAKKKGAKIVSINPLKEAGLLNFKNPKTARGLSGVGSELTDLYLQVKINEDVALLKAVLKKLLEEAELFPDVIDRNFIQSKTSGFENLKANLKNYDYNDLIQRTGLSTDDVSRLTDWVAKSKNIIVCWAMGLTQHKNAVDNIREIVNLLLLKGSIGRPGAGTCPVRGHSNVQGDRTMGIHERPSRALLQKITENFGFSAPEKPGYSVIEAIKAMKEGKARFFFALGGNFLPAAPDTYYTQSALENCEITAHVSTKLNRSHLYTGKTALILPCLGRTDKQPIQTVENSMGVVHQTRGTLTPPSPHLLSEVSIICRLANAALKKNSLNWSELENDYNQIRKLIEKTIDGFEGFGNKVKSGFELYNGARQGVFCTDDDKARFTLNKLPQSSTDAGKFLMMTIRSHDQFNTTVYGLDDRYRGVYNGRKVLFMNPDDIQSEKIDIKAPISIFNLYGGKKRSVSDFTIVPYNIPRGCVASYFPETNPLVPLEEYAHTSLTPASKSIRVNISQSVH